MRTIGIILSIIIAIVLQIPAYIIIIPQFMSKPNSWIIFCELFTLILIALISQIAGITFNKWFKSNLNN